MSKKNNKNTQKNQHAFDLRREKEAIQKKKTSQQKQSKNSPQGKKAVHLTKTKNKGFRIRKGVVIKGIRIKDAASKQKARELLAAEQAMREMEVDAQPPAPKSALDAMTE